MMAKIPKVTVTFDADLASLKTGVKNATTDVDSFSDRVTDFSKKAALAFAAAGAAIGAFAVASVKAAAEDEVGQKKLEETIRNTTNATAEQIKGIDKYVTAQSIATATSDDVIRPALSRLLRATGDLTKSQELLTLSQEISVATGKPLEAVTNAVAKSFEGSNTSLSKLGIGIDAANLKTLTFDETQQLLNKTFDGFIKNQSETAAFKFKQIGIAVNESKEAIGAALLPVVKRLADFLIAEVVPAIESFVAGLTGRAGLTEGLSESEARAIEWGKRVRSIIDTVIRFKDELITVAAVIGTVFLVNKIAAGVTATIALINTLIKAYNALKASSIIAGVASAFALNPLLGVAAVAIGAGVLAGANALANKSNTSAATVGAAGFSGTMPSGEAFSDGDFTAPVTGKNVIDQSADPLNVLKYSTDPVARAKANLQLNPNFNTGALNDAANSARTATESLANTASAFATTSAFDNNGTTINLNVNGAIDSEGTARTIIDTLNNSFYRGTNGAANLVTA